MNVSKHLRMKWNKLNLITVQMSSYRSYNQLRKFLIWPKSAFRIFVYMQLEAHTRRCIFDARPRKATDSKAGHPTVAKRVTSADCGQADKLVDRQVFWLVDSELTS